VSKVKLVCPSCGKPTRVGVHAGDDGKNVRYCKACEKDIPRPEA
jgi:large subunit ribosomal protein L24